MIDQAKANAVKPPDPSQKILVDPFIPKKVHKRFPV
jgi:hypothetical protein